MLINQTFCARSLLMVVALSSCGLTGCGDSSESTSSDEPAQLAEAPASSSSEPTSSSANGDQRTVEADGLAFDLPEGWTIVPLSDAQRGVIAAKVGREVDGEMVTATFSSAGGGVNLNIERWQGQFGNVEPSIEDMRVAGMSAKWIDLRGAYRAMFQARGQDTSDWRMLGVAVERQLQDYYIKLTGPRAQVNQIEGEFRKLVESGRVVAD